MQPLTGLWDTMETPSATGMKALTGFSVSRYKVLCTLLYYCIFLKNIAPRDPIIHGDYKTVDLTVAPYFFSTENPNFPRILPNS